jgi:hypothetical protein
MRIVVELRAVEVRLSHQFEEEIGAASSENGLFIAKMEYSVRTTLSRFKKSRSTDAASHFAPFIFLI